MKSPSGIDDDLLAMPGDDDPHVASPASATRTTSRSGRSVLSANIP